MADMVTAEQQQDALRPLRQFVNLLTMVTNDQSWANVDNGGYNQPNQYQTVGQYGAAVEGTPISIGQNGSVAVSSNVVMLVIGAAVVYFFLK
jgi:hypothetical protein